MQAQFTMQVHVKESPVTSRLQDAQVENDFVSQQEGQKV